MPLLWLIFKLNGTHLPVLQTKLISKRQVMLAVLLDLQAMISWITGIVNRTLVDRMVVLILTI